MPVLIGVCRSLLPLRSVCHPVARYDSTVRTVASVRGHVGSSFVPCRGTCFPVLSGRIRMNPRSEGTDRGLACFFSPTEGKAFRELKAAHRGFPTEMARLDGESPIGPSPQITERSMQGPDLSPHLADCSTTAPWKGPRHDARCESGVHSPCLARAPDAPPGHYPQQGESFPNSC